MHPMSFFGKSVWGRAGSAAGLGRVQGSPRGQKSSPGTHAEPGCDITNTK